MAYRLPLVRTADKGAAGMRLRPIFLAVLTLLASPAASEPMPVLEKIVEPQERPLLPKVLEAYTAIQSADGSFDVKTLDNLLPHLTKPTPLRGFIQYARALNLVRAEDHRRAREAIQESIRLLPGYSAPLLLASHIDIYYGPPAAAADYLIRAGRIDPELLNEVDDYDIGALLTRLDSVRDDKRAGAISQRLIETGWSRGTVLTNSSLAMRALEHRLDQGDPKGAAAMVPRLVSPSTLRRLLTENRYAALRAAAEDWAGTGLEKQWPIYLQETRSVWEAGKDGDSSRAYASALVEAGHFETLIATFLPEFSNIDAEEDSHLILIASSLASALAREGRWADADSVFTKALAVWPAGKSALAINLTGNRARLLFARGDFEAAVKAMDEVLADAKARSAQIDSGTFASMHYHRACSLHLLGRSAEDVTSSAIVSQQRVLEPNAYVELQLCRSDYDGALQTLLTALDNETTRGAVIAAVQPTSLKPIPTEHMRKQHALWQRLRADPKLVKAVGKYGRILPRPANATAPPQTMAQNAF